MANFSLFKGKKTYFAAIGLTALAIYQFSIGAVVPGVQSLLAALPAAGLRSAISGLKS